MSSANFEKFDYGYADVWMVNAYHTIHKEDQQVVENYASSREDEQKMKD